MTQDVGRIPQTTRAILHGIEQVFPAPEITGHAGGRPPVSEKKVKRGEADWLTSKELLGWLVDGDRRTVVLPPDKAEAYTAELRRLLQKKSIPVRRFRKIVGKLRFAALCLPSGRGLMTPLNNALRGDPRVIPSGKKSEVHESLGDWLQLIKSLAKRETSVHELVASSVDFYGYCDACNTGVGGVWLPLDSDLEPFVWRVAWPPDIVRRLSKYDGLSISDAECAGVLLQQMLLEQVAPDLKHKKIVSFCDNTPSVSRTSFFSWKVGWKLRLQQVGASVESSSGMLQLELQKEFLSSRVGCRLSGTLYLGESSRALSHAQTGHPGTQLGMFLAKTWHVTPASSSGSTFGHRAIASALRR
ncbi:hypothetical protein ACHAWF_011171 [Thalassiosira exigua]